MPPAASQANGQPVAPRAGGAASAGDAPCGWRRCLSGAGGARALAAVFLLFGTLATGLLTFMLPPFQSADELTHMMRAAQIADGVLLGRRVVVRNPDGSSKITAGGDTDPALLLAYSPFYAVHFHPEVKVTRAMWDPPRRWGSERVPGVFPNTATYPPIFYLPGAAGVAIGRGLDLNVVQTLYLARALTGMVAVAVASAAIALAGAAAVWLFALMTLPMSLSLVATPSQDALLLSCAALGTALVLRLCRSAPRREASLAGLVATLCLVTTARPPYVGLLLLMFVPGGVTLRWRLTGVATIGACVAAWSGLVAATTLTVVGDFRGADPAAQLGLLLHDPLRIVAIAYATLTSHAPQYLESFIGRLGWLDTPLPEWYRTAALVVLGAALLCAVLGQPRAAVGAGGRVLVVLALLCACGAVFSIQYLTWTPVGSRLVEGVQGRYFLPLAMFAIVAVPSVGLGRLGGLRLALLGGVAAFPILSLAVVMRTLVLRYYLG